MRWRGRLTTVHESSGGSLSVAAVGGGSGGGAEGTSGGHEPSSWPSGTRACATSAPGIWRTGSGCWDLGEAGGTKVWLLRGAEVAIREAP